MRDAQCRGYGWRTNRWWRGAVIYQIYPRSFMDTDGDGVGDLPGIVDKLDYIASLGVDAIWISPFFKSPMADFGYDIADYRDVDPLFGTLADFDRLLAKAHGLGIKVMIDQVLSHCSVEHEWFKRKPREPRQSQGRLVRMGRRRNPTARRPTTGCRCSAAWPGGGNRGAASTTCTTSCPRSRTSTSTIRRCSRRRWTTWSSGCERASTACAWTRSTSASTTAQLRDNPPKPAKSASAAASAPTIRTPSSTTTTTTPSPRTSRSWSSCARCWTAIRTRPALGEISSEDSLATMGEYVNDRRLHMGYSFELLTDDFSAAYIRAHRRRPSKRRWPMAGRAGRFPTTTCSAW